MKQAAAGSDLERDMTAAEVRTSPARKNLARRAQHRAHRVFRRPIRTREQVLHASNEVGVLLSLLTAEDSADLTT